MRKLIAAVFVFSVVLSCSAWEKYEDQEFIKDTETKLGKIYEYQEQIEALHPLLKNLYPVAVVKDEQFFVFVPELSKKQYVFFKQAPTNMPVPERVRAAFPLDFLDNRAACVVSPDVFDSESGYVTIFHEFVHCFQWESGEQGLKESLSIYRKAMDAQDFMWELNYPFPYQDENFEAVYMGLYNGLKQNHDDEVDKLRSTLREILGPENFEYLCWQEWKEGFARYIENIIRRYLGMEENRGGMRPPLNRVAFYEVGSRHIAFLEEREEGPTLNLETLFERIRGF